jgi:putative alpha-1,2-mannosidase
VQSIQLNGKPYTKTYISHSDIINGGTLKLFMGSKPNYNFGKSANVRPI